MSVSTVAVGKHLPTELTRVGFQFHVNSSVMNLEVSVGTTSRKYSPANHAGHAADGINSAVSFTFSWDKEYMRHEYTMKNDRIKFCGRPL